MSKLPGIITLSKYFHNWMLYYNINRKKKGGVYKSLAREVKRHVCIVVKTLLIFLSRKREQCVFTGVNVRIRPFGFIQFNLSIYLDRS